MSTDDAKRKVVLEIEDELIARIKRGDQIPDIRKWFLNRIGSEGQSGNALWFDDLTPFGQAFLNQTIYAYNEWQRQRKEEEDRARTGKLN